MSKAKAIIKIKDGVEKKFHNSVIIEKARWYYRETSDDGRLVIFFRSGLVYNFPNVKPRFAEAFINSSDQQVGTSFNKYIHNNFVVSNIKKTEKFFETMERAREIDQARKTKKARKKNAKLVSK